MTQPNTQPEHQREAGRARARGASRGDGGQFLAGPAEKGKGFPPHPLPKEESSNTYTYIRQRVSPKPLTLKTLPDDAEWWTALGQQYPGVDLYKELLGAIDWYRSHKVKSPKLFFRHWVEKAYRQMPDREETPDQIRARLRLVG